MNYLDYKHLFYLVCNIPYGGIGERSIDLCIKNNGASCSTKHQLLSLLLEAHGYEVKRFMGKVNLKKFGETLCPIIKVPSDVTDYHNFLALKIGTSWVKIDATFGIHEARKGLSTNILWDGESDCNILFPVDDYWEIDDIFRQKTAIVKELPARVKVDRAIFFENFIKYLRA